jgi:hypothetical protein
MSKSYDIDSRITECAEATLTHLFALIAFRKQLDRTHVDSKPLDDVIEGLEITHAKLTNWVEESRP